MLIKKTIVLSDGASAIGHLSIIRVGQETGLKLVLSAPLDGCYLAIKLSGKEQENFKVSGSRGEYSLSKNLDPNDQIGALIVCEDGIIASGGIKGTVNPKLKEFEKVETVEEVKVEEPKEVEEEPKVEEIVQSVESQKEAIEEIKVEPKVEEKGKEENRAHEGEEKVEEVKLSAFSKIRGENFYKSIRGKLSEILTANPRDKKLEELIPDSKWVRVYYDKGEYYVVGVLSDEGEVKFLAYGVPGVKTVKPPKEAEELCDFVEVESSIGEGYWIMFQNAKNGEIVKSI